MQYITDEDRKRLDEQLAECVGKRKGLSDRIGRARELGDLKENADYHAAKEDQGLNEARIRDLEEKIKVSIVADTDHLPDDIVFIGATVKLRDVDSEAEDLYKLVGDVTGNFDAEYIEVTPASPMGEALMKCKIGDVIRVDLRRGEKRFEIMEIIT